MTVSDLIEQLQRFQKEHPNVDPVVHMDGTFDPVALLIPTNILDQGPETEPSKVCGLQLAGL